MLWVSPIEALPHCEHEVWLSIRKTPLFCYLKWEPLSVLFHYETPPCACCVNGKDQLVAVRLDICDAQVSVPRSHAEHAQPCKDTLRY